MVIEFTVIILIIIASDIVLFIIAALIAYVDCIAFTTTFSFTSSFAVVPSSIILVVHFDDIVVADVTMHGSVKVPITPFEVAAVMPVYN